MEWSEAQIYELRAGWYSGLSTAAIGRRMGISKNSVVGKAHRLDLPPRPSPIRRVAGSGPNAAKPRRHYPVPMLPALACIVTPLPKIAAAAVVRLSPVKPVVVELIPKAGRVEPCCWPLGEPGTKKFHFCGDPSAPGRVYCADHCKDAYVPRPGRQAWREDAA